MKKKLILSICSIFWLTSGLAQNTSISPDSNKTKLYLGYDLGEMAFNRFQNFAGEIGLKFKNKHTLRFTYMNVKLTEKHLSSGFAGAVNGKHITGHWKGYDLIYDIPIYRSKKGNTIIYGGISAGYHSNTYEHAISRKSFNHTTITIGFGAGFRETNLFKIKGLYANFHIPLRHYFDTLEKTTLRNSTVNKVKLEQTLHFFIGYEF